MPVYYSMKKQSYTQATFYPWQEEVKRPNSRVPSDTSELLETTHREFTCTYCPKHPGGHPSRLWEVWTVPDGTPRARVPECVLLKLIRRQRAKWKMSDPEKAILSELLRLGVIDAWECPK